jgi:hypothetical protein
MMTMATKHTIIEEKLAKYLQSSKEGKGKLLDYICEITGMHRKAVTRRFNLLRNRDDQIPSRRGRETIYGPAVGCALKEVWELFNEICAKRLHPNLPEYVRVLAIQGDWSHSQEATGLLLKMSLASVKRRIAKFRKARRPGKGFSSTKPSALKEIIPVRRGPWENPLPGNGEVDSVAHCGVTLIGDYAYSVQYTDVATLWMCLAAQWNKGQIATLESIKRIESHLPFPLLGLDPDSGCEFINWQTKEWCDAHLPPVLLTRIRPYHKNDHARIEQKNYVNIRQWLAYVRIENPAMVCKMNRLYDLLEDFVNFFLPSEKCVAKEHVGSRYRRRYDLAQTAYRRALTHPAIGNDIKERLRAKYATLNPKQMKRKIDQLVTEIFAEKSINSR